LQWYGVSRLLDIDLPFRALGWEVLSALVMGGVVFGLSRVIRADTYTSLFGLVALGFVTYATLVVLDPDIRQVVDKYLPLGLPIPR